MSESLPLLPPSTLAAAQTLFDYLQVGHTLPERASLIMALGSNDPRVADRAADLYLEGRAPLLLFSGGVGALTQGQYGGLSEAAYFAQLAMARGVPEHAILVEGASTNTGENIRFSRALLEQHGVALECLILVQKPFMERRTLATFLAQWGAPPMPAFSVTSPRITLQEYPLEGAHRLGMKDVVEVMCGDMQRIAVYPTRTPPFQVWQSIPEAAWLALKHLVRQGFVAHMLRLPGVAQGSTDPNEYEGLCAALPPSETQLGIQDQ
jgi:hypothetical protein